MSLAWLKIDVLLGSIGKAAAASMLIASLGLTGCSDDPPKKGVSVGCTLNSDCNSGLVCSFGLCHNECKTSDDCPDKQRCVQGTKSNVCQLNEEAECHFKSDCDDPLVCAIDLQCRNQCQEDEDCLKGQKCADKVCAEPTEVDMNGDLIVNLGGAGGSGGGSTGGSGGTSGGGGTAGTGATGMGGEGGEPPATCTPGGECIPEGKPCAVGILSCVDGKEQCDVMSDADDGTECGADKVCEGGECVACKVGTACQPDANNVCIKGTTSCANGPACDQAGNTDNGTECGTDKVCSAGACVDCKVGDSCQPTNTCKNGTLACAAGPVCNPTTNKGAGTECDTGKVCDSAGACVACVQDGPCDPQGNECHVGIQDCKAGPKCEDSGQNSPDGTSCTGQAAYNFCTNGNCAACSPSTACVPANPCHQGSLNCQTTPPTCADLGTNAADGLACGDSKSCITGQCLTNDRVLTLVGNAPGDVPVDAPYANFVVKLVDKNGAAVPATAITVTATAGAYGQATNTSVSGQSTISGRVGRAIGGYKLTISAPGATSIDVTVKAVAPTDDHVYTIANVLHLPGAATAGPATLSKFYNSMRAIASAADGTLYVADYAAVYKITPAGAMTRVVGDPSGTGCGSTGDNGPGTSAKVCQVAGLALDEVNNYLYIADYYGHTVRLLDLASGKIYRFAGGGANSGIPYGVPGPADAAYITPTGVGVAPNGDVYISDYNSGDVLRVDQASQISVFRDRQTCDTSKPTHLYYCDYPPNGCGFAWDKAGQLFVSGRFCGDGQSYSYGVARVNADNTLTMVAGNDDAATAGAGEGGTATSTGFSSVPDIVFDKAGNLLMTTRDDNRVRRVDALTSTITTIAGTGTETTTGEYVLGNTATTKQPTGIALDSANNVYFLDNGGLAVRGLWNVGDTVGQTGKLATTAGNNQSVKRDALFGSMTVNLKDGANANIPGVPVQWKRLQTGPGLSSTGASSLPLVTNISGNSSMTGRVGLAAGDYTFEASFADIHGVAVTGSPQTFKITATDPDAGTIFTVANIAHTTGTYAEVPATFSKMTSQNLAVVSASDGTIYTSDQCSVYKITPRGELTLFAGSNACGFSGDSGPAVGAKLNYPRGLALDETNGRLYIADYSNKRIRMVTLSDGKISTYAGGGAVVGEDGAAISANIGNPWSVTVGPDGEVYIPDTEHYNIRVIDADGNIHNWLTPAYQNGNCKAGVLNLYYADDHTVVRFAANGDAYVAGYVCDGPNAIYAILKKSDNSFTRVAGKYQGATTDDILATEAGLPEFGDFVFDANGDIVLTTYSDDKIRRIKASDSTIKTIAGNTQGYAGDYTAAAAALFANPRRLAIWPGNHILIADLDNVATRMIW
jgi:trimeric autotransporter adhesin